MQAKDIPDVEVLKYLSLRQGSWTCLWYGHFKESDPSVSDVYYSMPEGTPQKVALAKMKALYKRGLVGGCGCGCRGDFEITDKGLELLGLPRIHEYTGY